MKRRSDCPISCWLDLFGDKWTLLIIRDILIFEKKNYKDFIQAEEKISTNILADRLKKLVEHGVLTKRSDTKNRLLFNYAITERGKRIAPILMQITQWSNDYIPETNTFANLVKKKRKLNA